MKIINKTIRKAYKTRKSGKELFFIFTSNNVKQALRRWKYLRKLSDYRRNLVSTIQIQAQQVSDALAELNHTRKQKVVLLSSKETEKKELETEDEFFRMGRVNPLIYPDFKYALAKSHDNCRTMALKGDYDYLLHLESDVFPPVNVIERLLDARKKVVGAMYHIELGEKSTLMIQHLEEFGEAKRETYNLGETDLDFVDGSVKKIFSCGLGCVLIHKSVLKEVPFRYEEGAPVHPDSFFFADLDMKDISA